MADLQFIEDGRTTVDLAGYTQVPWHCSVLCACNLYLFWTCPVRWVFPFFHKGTTHY